MSRLLHICKKCGTCCRKEEIGPIVTPKEAKEISSYLNVDYEIFLKQMCMRKYINTCQGKYEIYFLNKTSMGCIFLNGSLCGIYEHRPYQCKNTPLNFMAEYTYWKHLLCVNKQYFEKVDSSKQDKDFLLNVLKGYGGN